MAGLWSAESYRKYMGDQTSDDTYSAGLVGLNTREARKYKREQDRKTRQSDAFKDWRKSRMRYSGDPTYDDQGNKQYDWSMTTKDWRQAKKEGGDFANWGNDQNGDSGGGGAPDNSEEDAAAQDEILKYKDKGDADEAANKPKAADPRQLRKDAIARRKESLSLTRLKSRIN
jgi:hypothetical protein